MVLAGACAGLTVLMLDSTVVNLALPELHRALDASTSQLQLFVNGYLVVIAALVVTAGRLGDIFGRRRMFLLGMSFFGVGSLIAGFSQSAETPSLSSKDAAELEGLAAGTASAQEKLSEQSSSVAAAITTAVDEAAAYALSNTLWLAIGLSGVGAILAWSYIRSPESAAPAAADSTPSEPLPEPPEHPAHRFRFHL